MSSGDLLSRRSLAVCLGVVLAGVVLLVAGASRSQIASAAMDPQAYVSASGADEFVLALATALGWVLLVWVTLGVFLVLGTAAPGVIGWLFHLLARLLLPATLRRFVSLALGVTLLTGTSVASAAPPVTTSAITVTVDWPAAAQPSRGAAPDWPSAPTAPGQAAQPEPVPPDAADQPDPRSRGGYAVQPGDCLWDIAERALVQAGAPVDVTSVAASVAQWWHVNRGQIENPDVIYPGQILAVPTFRP